MDITLEKIELVKDRTGVSYKEAKETLEANGGSVVDAIIAIEESIGEKTRGRVSERSLKIVEKIKELVKKGNVSKIVIKKDGEIVLNLPVNIGIVGTVIAPWAAVLGVLAAFGTKCAIEIIKDDGSIVDISEMANDTLDDVVERSTVIADEFKTRGTDVYNNVKTKTAEVFHRAEKEDEEEGQECCKEHGCCKEEGSQEEK